MLDHTFRSKSLGAVLVLATLGLSSAAFADSGFYVGGSVGDATVSADIPDPGFGNNINFDESDFAWKAYGGFIFDWLPLLSVGVEAGYVDLGSPSMRVGASKAGIDVNGWDAFGLAGLDFGPLGVFVKYGVVSWDADLQLDNLKESESGSDPAYGVGLRVDIGSLEVRGEYEVFDIDDADDVYMTSIGVVWRF